MSRKSKGFGINTQNTLLAANSAVGTALNFNKNSQFFGNLNVTLVSLSLIEPDLENPRPLKIRNYIRTGLHYNNPTYSTQKEEIIESDLLEELNKLEHLASSIKQNGLLNAIVVYKDNNQFKIIAGERRYLACLLLNLDSIPVKILNKPPTRLEIKLIQWAENCDREDLSAWDKLQNVQQILSAYNNDHSHYPTAKPSTISVRELAKIMNIKKSQAGRYLFLLKNESINNNVLLALKENKLTSIKTAEFLCSINDKELQKKLIKLAENKVSISRLKSFLNKKPNSAPALTIKIPQNNLHLLRTIIKCTIENNAFYKYKHNFDKIDWENQAAVRSAWNKLIKHTKEVVNHDHEKQVYI